MSSCSVSDALVKACGLFFKPNDEYVYVYDGYWQASHSLWEQVQTADWGDVILNSDMKKALTELMTKFFDSKDVYKDLGVPWKRGMYSSIVSGLQRKLSAYLQANSHEVLFFMLPCCAVRDASY